MKLKLLLIAILFSALSWGQTSYLGLDGGFEGTATIDNTVNATAQASKWTKTNAALTLASESSIFRSGAKSIKATSTSTSAYRVVSPAITMTATTTKWVLQYYRYSTSTNITGQHEVVRAGSATQNGSYSTVGATGTWEKVVYAPATVASATTGNIASLIKLGSAGSNDFYFDDFAFYESSTGADITAPTAPTAPLVGGATASSLDVSWTAASGGVDGGGYIVVRGIADPTTAPNVNGIYAVSNLIAAGMTVVYNGTGTSFTDAGLSSSTQYFYRIYTYDKAYNYSAAITGNGTTLGGCTAPTTQASLFTTGSLTSTTATIGWTRGSGDNVIVVARTAATTDPASGTAYAADAAYGSGDAIGSGRVVYNGTGTSVTVTNLLPNTTYNFDVYEYASTGTCYNTTELTGSALTSCAAPTTQASFGTITPTTTTASVAVVAGNGSGRLVKINTTNSFTDPTDGTAYTASLAYGGGEQVIGAGTTTPLAVTGLTANTTYYVAVYEYNCTGTRIMYNMVEGTSSFTTVALVPTIAVTNPTPAAQAHNSTYTYSNTSVGTNNDIVFTITNSGLAILNISSIVVSGATYSLQGVAPTTVAASGGTAIFTVRFTPTAIGAQTGSVTINTNATPAAYVINFTGNGVGNANSHIIVDTSFTYPTNIPYINYLGSDVTLANSIEVGRFIAYDGTIGSGDLDTLPTIMSSIQFTLNNSANVSRVALYDITIPATPIEVAEVAGADPVIFPGLSQSIPDNGSKTYSLRVLFNTIVTDNQQIVFKQTFRNPNSGNGASSAFVSSDAPQWTSTAGDDNRIEVTATQLAFVQQPSNAGVNAVMSPAVTVQAEDLYHNKDLDYTTAAQVTSTGTLTGTPVSTTTTAGLATFSSLTHTLVGTGFTLGATSGTLIGATSTTFDIVSIVYLNGDYRTTGTGTWLSNNATPAIWERYTSATSTWATSNSPTYSTANNVYIRNGHTITTGGSFGSTIKLIVENGGYFISNHTGTTASIIIRDGGELDVNASLTNNGALEVEDNGTLLLYFPFGNPSTSIWKGTENFHPNSDLYIWDWDPTTTLINADVATNLYNGYTAAFGNVFIDISSGTQTANWELLGTSFGTKNITHGDLQFLSPNGYDVRFCSTSGTTINAGIKGYLYLGPNWSSARSVVLGTSTANVTVTAGQVQIDSPGDLVLRASNSNGGGVTLNILGDLIMDASTTTTNTNLVMNRNSYTTALNKIATLNLNGNLSIGTNATIINSAPQADIQFNLTGTTAQQTIKVLSNFAGTSTSNKLIPFTVKTGAYGKLLNDFTLDLGSILTVESGATFDNNGEYQVKNGGAGSTTSAITVAGRFITQDAEGFNGSTAAIPTIVPTLNAGSFVEFAKAGNQIVTNFTPKYKNVDITGTGTKTLGHATDVWVDEDLRVLSSTLLVNNSEAITVNKALTVTSGIFDIKNSGQLIQINETDNNAGTYTSTNFKVERIAQASFLDYIYWGAPTKNFPVANIPTNNRYEWNTLFANTNGTLGNWIAPTTTNMTAGKGYIARASNGAATGAPVALTTNFYGQPNNGTLTTSISRGGKNGITPYDAEPSNPNNPDTTTWDDNWNLVSNPYPSAINAKDFYTFNTNIQGFVQIWKHTNAPASNAADQYYQDFQYNYSDDYVTFNNMGSSPTSYDGYIPSGQGFMICMNDDASSAVTTNATENVSFKNSMRRAAAVYRNDQFYKTTTIEENKSRIWLDLVPTTGGASRALIGYADGATNDVDRTYDAITQPASELLLYSLANPINPQGFAIQGRALPFDINDRVPLGVNIIQAGDYKIGIGVLDGLFANNGQTLYIEDTMTNTINNISIAPYAFTAAVGDFKNRFILRYTASNLETTTQNSEAQITVLTHKDTVEVKATKQPIQQIEIFDLLGRTVITKDKCNDYLVNINTAMLATQPLIIKITLTNGTIKTQKIIKQ